jgi:hypothetical protein
LFGGLHVFVVVSVPRAVFLILLVVTSDVVGAVRQMRAVVVPVAVLVHRSAVAEQQHVVVVLPQWKSIVLVAHANLVSARLMGEDLFVRSAGDFGAVPVGQWQIMMEMWNALMMSWSHPLVIICIET